MISVLRLYPGVRSVSTISLVQTNRRNFTDFGCRCSPMVHKNWSDFEGRKVMIKVTARSNNWVSLLLRSETYTHRRLCVEVSSTFIRYSFTTKTGSCGIARFPCDSMAFLLVVISFMDMQFSCWRLPTTVRGFSIWPKGCLTGTEISGKVTEGALDRRGRDYDTTTIRLQSDYDVSRAIRCEQKWTRQFFVV